MAPFPEEVDVFTGPHWRMKQLVGLYCDKLSKTNFSNNNDFRALLQSLYATFKEFKMHEQIENEYIIGLLQQRSRTIYNVHSDNKLSEMLSLFEKGLKNVKNEYEQLNYAKQLKERLEAFTRDFLPHMKEEEEVFQPMLMEYFTYEELKDIKKKVIAQHCSQKDTAELLRGLNLWNQAEERQKFFKYSVDEKSDKETDVSEQSTGITHLPPEVMLSIFSYLNPQELCRCSQVSTKWSQLAKTGSLWKHLYPVHWARGDWYSGPATDLDTEPDEEWVQNRKARTRLLREKDLLLYSGSEKSEQETGRALLFLSLSGCYQITDHGLRVLTLGGGLPYLEHLNLSGCLTVTGAGLQDLVSACPSLNDEYFYYCDNINGPHADTASGCQNLQCGFRACCRSGE
uniref:F-box/LRR-repeat protein 5 n=1 Tax=Rousettus aegyptiacus TaxID=9407 RepID=A0A7J8E7E2_ROUAE|nr:F-box and leucine rich repeat protein 5 [Rousettus aegyptiacus]